jgi:hypothetical protein
MPPLTLENASALVSGGVSAAAIEQERKDMQANPLKPKLPETLKVKVVRAFMFNRERQEVGSTPTLPRVFALEMQAANKVELLPEAPPAPAAAPATASTASDGKGATRKGETHAR